MRSANITFDDIDNAVKGENLDISGGLLDVGNMKRNLQLKGQFHTAADISQIIVRSPNNGGAVYLKDIATIKDTIRDRESYARLDGKNVVTLNIIKRSGENLINTSDDVNKTVDEMRASYPKDLNIVVTGDLSTKTRTSFNDLVNSIVIGFMLVLIILMFFMGVVNAFFVALSVPLSMFVGLCLSARCRYYDWFPCHPQLHRAVRPVVRTWVSLWMMRSWSLKIPIAFSRRVKAGSVHPNRR